MESGSQTPEYFRVQPSAFSHLQSAEFQVGRVPRWGAALASRQAAPQTYEHHVAQIAAFEPAATAADYGIAQALKP